MQKNNIMAAINLKNPGPSVKYLISGAKRIALQAMLTSALLLTCTPPASACDACKQQQPKILQGITHGAGPESNWDYLIVMIMVLITLYSLYATIKCIAVPGEKKNEHVKRMILNQ